MSPLNNEIENSYPQNNIYSGNVVDTLLVYLQSKSYLFNFLIKRIVIIP